MAVEDKLLRLKETLLALESVVVAFSGGVDSTFLLAMCRDVLGGQVLAVTADSPLWPAREVEGAAREAGRLGVRHLVLPTRQMQDPGFVSNPPDRCYLCKRALLGDLGGIARHNRILHVVEGSNLDDQGDYRPGGRAVEEVGVRRPLLEVGLTRAEIRGLSRDMGLASWNKPSQPCLATRIPFGSPITLPALVAIDAAETFIGGLGLEQVRVRHHGRTAVIEVGPPDMGRLAAGAGREGAISRLKQLGYHRVLLDLEGYRPGSLNEGVAP